MDIFWSLLYTLLLSTTPMIYSKKLTISREQIIDHSLYGTNFRRTEDKFDNPWKNETFCKKAKAHCKYTLLWNECTRCECDNSGLGGSGGSYKTFVSYKSGCMNTKETLQKLSGNVCILSPKDF